MQRTGWNSSAPMGDIQRRRRKLVPWGACSRRARPGGRRRRVGPGGLRRRVGPRGRRGTGRVAVVGVAVEVARHRGWLGPVVGVPRRVRSHRVGFQAARRSRSRSREDGLGVLTFFCRELRGS